MHYKPLQNTVHWSGGANSGLLIVHTSERGTKEALTRSLRTLREINKPGPGTNGVY